jgi:hypothetical protein
MIRTIHVTEAHNAQALAQVAAWRENPGAGLPHDYCACCVVAVALREQWDPTATVGGTTFGRFGNWSLALPEVALRAVVAFDNRQPFVPITFTFDDEGGEVACDGGDPDIGACERPGCPTC